jgi:catechol 2,3-dioxygenase-like lactoylglutathione lyase family enzyme
MLGYVTIGTNDIDRSVAFYDAALGAIGAERSFKDGSWAGYKREDEDIDILLCAPHDGARATFGNGSMLAFKAKDRASVEAFFAAALKQGGGDEGGPGVRGEQDPPFYAAYVRDPEGNKLCCFCRA